MPVRKGKKRKVSSPAKTKRMGGPRNPGPSATIREAIVRCLEQGNYPKTAYTLAGIPESTYYDWMKIGEEAQGKSPKIRTKYEQSCLEFSESIKKAQESSVEKNLEIINSVAMGGTEARVTEFYDKEGNMYKKVTDYTPPSFPAAAWILERTRPEEFSLRGRIEVNKNETVNHNVNINKTEVKVEITNANAGSVLDVLAECGAIPPPNREAEH